MAGKIKGITIEFNGDATKLNKALRQIKSETKSVDSQLRDVNRALKFNPKNTELLAQKQTLLKEKIKGTKTQLEQFKKAQAELDAKGVDKNSQEYMKLRREIITTESKLDHFNAELKKTARVKLDQLSEEFKNVGSSMMSVGGKMSMAGAGLAVAGKKLLDSAKTQTSAENKLIEVYRARMGATEGAARATMDLASEMQSYGIIGDEVTLSGAQQLATFAKYPSTVNKLMPAMDNLLAQQKGYDATTQDATNVANLMGKAMQGQVGALTRVGISFTDAQAEVLKYGTEEERAAMLADVITSNVGEMNKKLAETDEGKIQSAKNSLGDMAEELGMALSPAVASLAALLSEHVIPLIERFTAFCQENPVIGEIVVGATAVLVVLGPLIVMLGALVSAVGTLIPVLMAVNLPMVLIVAAITAVIAIGIYLMKHWDEVKEKASKVWNNIKETIAGVVEGIRSNIQTKVDAIKSVFEGLKSAVQFVADKFGTAFGTIKSHLGNLQNSFDRAKTALIRPFQIVYDKIKEIANKLKSVFDVNFTIPRIKLPHFTKSGKFSLNPPSVPRFGVEWYKHGGIMTKPTAFGLNGSNLMVGGEAGPEAIAPIGVLQKYVSQAVKEQSAEQTGILLSILGYLQTTLPNMQNNVVLDTGELVGSIAPGINKELGKKTGLSRRGI